MPPDTKLDRSRTAVIAYDVCRRALTPARMQINSPIARQLKHHAERFLLYALRHNRNESVLDSPRPCSRSTSSPAWAMPQEAKPSPRVARRKAAYYAAIAANSDFRTRLGTEPRPLSAAVTSTVA